MNARVLVIENDIATAELIRINLEREGFRVRCYSTGNAAIAHLAETKEDLLILDYSLPDMTGKEVIEILTEKNLSVPFVVITGHGDERIAVEMMKRGSRDYIIKDSTFLNLLPSAVTKVLNQVETQKKIEMIEAELETSHHFNQLILDALPCLAYILDKKGNIISSNRSKQTGSSLPSAKDFLDTLEEEQLDFFQRADSIVNEGTTCYEELLLKDQTWEIHWIPLNKELCICYAFDVTEQRAIERVVRSSEEERYRALVKNLPVGLFRSTIDYKSKITMFNPAAAKIFGYDPDEVDFEINILDYYVNPGDRENLFAKLMSEGRVIQHEALLKNRYNHPLWISITANVIRDHKGTPLYVDGMLEDVTKRKQTEEALVESESRYRAIVQDQTEFITRWSPEGPITFVNDACCRFYGKSREELLSESFEPYIHEKDREKVKESIAALTLKNPVNSIENRTLRPDGTVCWLQWTNRALFDAEGKIIEYQSAGHDITERKRAEEELKKRRDHLSALVETQKTLLSLQGIEEFLPRILEILGKASNASRVYLYKRILCEKTSYVSLWKEWCAPGVLSQMNVFHLKAIPEKGFFSEWAHRLRNGEYISVMIDDLPKPQRDFFSRLEPSGKNFSILLFPLIVQGGLYGLIGFDNLKENREWDQSEIELLDSAAASISLGLERKLTEQEILNYREHLEELVAAKTAEITEANKKLEEEILEKIKREKELKESSEYLNKVINTLPDPLFVKDTDHRWVLLNNAFCSFVGRPRHELIGKSDYDFFPPEEARVFWEKDDLVFRTQEDSINEEFFTDSEGITHTIITKKTIYNDQKGRPFLLGVIRDITELKHLQEELIRSERLAAVGTLASGISHEFNNINVAILGFSELALSRFKLEPQLHDWIERIHNSALRAKSITQNLLAFGRVQKSSHSLQNLSVVVRGALELARCDLATDQIVFHLDLRDVPDTLMDENQITQVILNLLINARHAMLGRPTKELTIETGVRDGMIFARFTDTGCGIPEKNIKDIFTPFFTTKGAFGTNPSEASIKGTGLGLSVSHTILKNHNGKITVESKEDVGSTFTLLLPSTDQLSRDASAKKETTTIKKTQKSSSAASRPHDVHKIVVLDDEPDTQDLFALYFEPLGFKVIKTDDGEKALSIIADDSIDFVMADIQMPKLNGVEFLRKLAAFPEDKQPIIFMITGRSNDAIIQDCLDLGAAEIILKPFRLDKIRELIQDHLQKRAGSST